MDLLKEMYYGRIVPFGEMRIKSTEYQKAVKKMNEAEKKLIEEHPEIEDVFGEYRTAMVETSIIAEYERFAMGFRVGVQLMAEILKSSE